MKPDPSLERLVDATLAKLREKMLHDLSEGTPTRGTLDQIEDAVAHLGDEFRRTLQEELITEQTRAPRDNTVDCACGQRARYRTTRKRLVITRHGELTIARPYYYCSACRRGFAPLDQALALHDATVTTQVACWMAELAARLPFAEATDLLALLTQVHVSPATLERSAVSLGEALSRAQQEEAARHHAGQAPPVARKPKRLYVSMDGIFTPLRDLWKRDGSLGALSCRFGECKTAVVYEANALASGDTGVLHRAYLATLEPVEVFAPRVATLAHRWGHHFAKELVVLGDGAPWIWNVAAAQFPTGLQILDFFHVSQYLFAFAYTFLGEGSDRAKEWVKTQQAELKNDGLATVLQTIRGFVAGNEEQKRTQATVCRYFEENAERMRYGTYLAKGYQIGSGVMEASCKHVVGERLDRAGMHWRQASAEAIVTLRAALLSSSPPDLRSYCRPTSATLPPS